MEIKKDKRTIIGQKSFWLDIPPNWRNGDIMEDFSEMWPTHAKVMFDSRAVLSPEHPKDPQYPNLKVFYFPYGLHGDDSWWKEWRNRCFEITRKDGRNEVLKANADMLRIYFYNFDVDSDGWWWWNQESGQIIALRIAARVANVEKKGEIALYYSTSLNSEEAVMHFRKGLGWDRDFNLFYVRRHWLPAWPFLPTKSFLRKDEKVKPLPDTPAWAHRTGAIYLRTGKELNRYSLWAVVNDERYLYQYPSTRMMLERKAIYKTTGEQYNTAWYPPQIVNAFEKEDKTFLATVITPLIQKDKVKIEGRWYDKNGKYLRREKSLIARKRLKEAVFIDWELTGNGSIKEMFLVKGDLVSTLSYSFRQEQVKNKTGFNIVDSLRQIFNLNLTEKETAIIGEKGINSYDNSYFLYRSNLKKITYAGKPLLYGFKRG